MAECAKKLYNMTDKVGRPAPLLSDKVYQIILDNKDKINAKIDYSRDFNYDFFGFKTLEKSYLLRVNSQVAERPQQMLMRVSIGIHEDDLDAAFATYDGMSN